MELAFPHDGTPPNRLTRRELLGLTGKAALLAVVAPSVLPASAWAADSYDAMRATWVDIQLGTGFNPAAAPFAAALTKLGTQAAGYRDTMTSSGAALWTELPVGTVSAHVTSAFRRLRVMAMAYRQPGTGLTGDAALAAKITTGLDRMHTNVYTPTTTTYNNWWDWQIGAPQGLLDTALLMYDQLSSTQLANYAAAIDHFVPTSVVSAYTGNSTGANRADLCRVLGLRGVMTKNATLTALGASSMVPIFPYVRNGDGLYADGSFVQHTWIPYAGSYGQVLLGNIAKILSLYAGSPWAITDPLVQNAYAAVDNAFAPFIYNGLVMDGVSGRGISRGTFADPNQNRQSDHVRGHSISMHILRLANSGAAPAAQAAAWRSMVKGWMQREYYEPLLSNPGLEVTDMAQATALLNDSGVSATAEPVNHRLFGMDRSVHRRPTWAAQISMCSSRTGFYEYGNGENVRGYHTNSGMLSWWGSNYSNGQYSDEFWPTVDPYSLPGTTVSLKALPDSAGQAWGKDRPNAAWAGGATDGTFAAVGQDVRGLQSTLVGKKSWFCLDDSIFCLGAGITSTDGTGVRSTVDNRNMGPNNTFVFSVDGVTQPSTLGWNQTFTDPEYMTVNGMGSWVFPQGGTVKAQRVARTGSWRDINVGGSTAAISRNYVTMTVEHGTDPTGASYCYQVMPGATSGQAAARAAAPNVTVLANTATVQAISVPGLGLTMANFFAAGTAGPLTVDKPCSVLVREQGGTMTVVVSDPTRAATTVRVTIAKTGYPKVGAAAGITALSTASQIVLLAEVGGTLGVSRTITLSGTGTTVVPGTASHLPASATTYVRDGSYADTNYGNQTTMTVKNTNTTGSGYTRRALTKFDLTGLSGTVQRAVLWVNGVVSDSAGTVTTLRAFAMGSSWSESTVTWNTAPALGGALGTGQLGGTADWVGLDVTSAVAAAQASGTVSLAVYEPLGAVGLAAVLYTRLNGTNPPQLEVVTG
ncbi:polysaccharide lyase family 8 super-sandwich domain-containing protein [Actinokineospora sp. HUAS TT18]|uniref:polysaccharide lyase family 8 super-sandwich domain-containing protein n=1 Tax=Actinokineospora sp. HUAS TT18 TaxID=3447451 RepID=UPI003F51D572